jgi:toxin ParE1/3/4
MSYRISKRADKDLDDIWFYIAAQTGVDIADRIDREIHDAVERLAQWPGIGHQRADVPSGTYRFWSVYQYLIVYRMQGSTLIVVRVIHGSRDLRRIFPPRR